MAFSITQLRTPNLGKVADTLVRTAGAKAALMAAQRASPTLIKTASRIFQAADLLQAIFGTPFEEKPNELMGWLTPRQVAEIQSLVRQAGPVRKNLFCIRIADPNPPPMEMTGNAAGAGVVGLFDLLAVDVSYSPVTLTGDKVQIGSAVMDKVIGTEAVEIQVTTIDDETGTLKRWFEAKAAQVANRDGTFNPQGFYSFEMEIVHGLPHDHGIQPTLPAEKVAAAYSNKFRVRVAAIQFEMSRRDQALQELQMTFTQVDTWNQPKKK